MTNIEAHICNCVNLRRAANRLTEYYDSILKPYHLSTNQFTLLASLYKNPTVNTSELSKIMHLERTTIIRNLKPLLDRKLINKDIMGHKNSLSLSVEGHALLKQAYHAWKLAQHNYEQYIGSESLATLRDLLVKTSNI